FDSPDAVAAQTLRRVRATHAAGVAAVPLGTATAPLPIQTTGSTPVAAAAGPADGDPSAATTTTSATGSSAPLPGRVLATYLSGESARLPTVLDTYTAGRRHLQRETP